MKLFLRIFVTLSLVGWAAAGWIWREEIGARVAAWRGSERAVELVDRAEQRAAEAVSRTAEEWRGAVAGAFARAGGKSPRYADGCRRGGGNQCASQAAGLGQFEIERRTLPRCIVQSAGHAYQTILCA